MTPKEKARELVDKLLPQSYNLTDGGSDNDGNELQIESDAEQFDCAKYNALITVEEVLENCLQCVEHYWNKVKIEIENYD